MDRDAASHTLPHLEENYSTVEEALAGLTALEEAFRLSNDRRAVFVGAYITITSAMQQTIAEGEFEDCEWVRRYLLDFVQLYLQAVRAFDQGALERVPSAWRIAFDLSARGEGSVLQHLLLGVNAHINHDLAIALQRAGIDPDRPVRYSDHTGVNQVLKRTVNTLQEHVERLYSPALRVLDELFGQWDEEFACLIVDKAREKAWEHCLALVDCTSDEERVAVLRALDSDAGALAEVLARHYASPVHLLEAMRASL